MQNVPDWCYGICGALLPAWLLALAVLARLVATAPVMEDMD